MNRIQQNGQNRMIMLKSILTVLLQDIISSASGQAS